MTGLKDQFKGVNTESLTVQDTEDILEEETEEYEVDTDVDTDVDTEDPVETKSKGRTIENVYGELTRKQKEDRDNLMSQISSLGNMVQTLTEQLSSKSTAGAQGPKTLDDYSVADLTQYRDSLSADDPQRSQYDSLIADKIVNQKVVEQVHAITGRERMKSQRESAVTQAIERYPELRDESSSFYQKVDAKVRALPDDYKAANPRVVMDVANEVAIAEGINPSRVRQTLRVPGKPSATRRDGAPAAPASKPKLTMSDAEARAHAKKLEGAMGRKFTNEEIMKIRENHQSYSDNRNLFTR